MGTVAKTMHGARAQLSIQQPDGSMEIIGIFNNVGYGIRYDANPIHVLGRFSAAEIVLSGMEAVSISASGFRVVDNGPHKIASVPMLQQLLQHEDITITLYDRQTKKEIMTVIGVRPVGYNTSVSARGLQDLSVEFMGLRMSDESGDQDESPGATDY